MDFDTFIANAWDEHGDRPQDVADRLAASLHLVVSPAHIPPYTRLAAHVFGEHLGQWGRGVKLIESLRRLPAFDGGFAAVGALARGVATLRYASGDPAALDALSREDRVAALAGAAAALAGRNDFKPAIGAYTEALRLAEPGLPNESAALRALAIGGNNLAAALETRRGRDAGETAGMVAAAEGGLKYWKLAGTWFEEQRAEYRLARSLLQAGAPEAARHCAERCIAVCENHAAPAFERFFGHAVLALAQRAMGDAAAFETARDSARQLYTQVAAEERHWCDEDLAELEA